MSYKKYIKNKIAFVNNNDLFANNIIKGGHYVYIRSYDSKSNTCVVNTLTSLEDKNHIFKNNRLQEVKNGNIYPIPKNDTNMPLWTGVSSNPIFGVKVSNLKIIDKKRIKKRHRFFINLFLLNKRYR